MSIEALKKRIKKVRRRLADKGLNGLVVTAEPNVKYITGFSGADSWAVITHNSIYLVTDSRYSEQAKKQCQLCRIILRTESMTEAVGEILKKLKSAKTIAVEGTCSISLYRKLKKDTGAKLKAATGIIEELRSIKDTNEAASIKKAASAASESLAEFLGSLKPGITENEAAGRLDFQLRRAGVVNSFDTIVAFGPNAANPHHIPSRKKLKTSDTILIDFGARYKNYCSDITRCFTLGRVSRFYKKVYDVVLHAQSAAIELIRDGAQITDIDAAAREVIKSHDLPVYEHGTGHGLGLEVHELPVVSNKSKGKLKAGQIITIEPGVYLPGRFGIRIEDDILVTKTGCTILSNTNLKAIQKIAIS